MIALYAGIGKVSWLIQKWHRGPFSHVSEIDDDAAWEVESWFPRGVTMLSPFVNHQPGTPVHLYHLKKPLTTGESDGLKAFYASQVGKPYDLRGVLGFISRRDNAGRGQNRWFCGELIHAAYIHVKRPLLNPRHLPPHKAYPSILAYSTEIQLDRIAIVPAGQAGGRWQPRPI